MSIDNGVSQVPLFQQLRVAIGLSGVPLGTLARLASVDRAQIHRFLTAERDIRLESADRIASTLGIDVFQPLRIDLTSTAMFAGDRDDDLQVRKDGEYFSLRPSSAAAVGAMSAWDRVGFGILADVCETDEQTVSVCWQFYDSLFLHVPHQGKWRVPARLVDYWIAQFGGLHQYHRRRPRHAIRSIDERQADLAVSRWCRILCAIQPQE